jgi:CheY-like chemotaxis protein
MRHNVAELPLEDLELARVLVVHDDLPARLTLQAVLEAGGYTVDAASSAAEALGKLNDSEYELVLSEMRMESPDAGLEVLAHARLMKYAPATGILTTSLNAHPDPHRPTLIESENVPELLGKIADLISHRAARLVEAQRGA